MKNIWYHTLGFDKDINDMSYYRKARHEITNVTKKYIYTITSAYPEPDKKVRIENAGIGNPIIKENTSSFLSVEIWSPNSKQEPLDQLKKLLIEVLTQLKIETPKSLEWITP